MHQPISMIIYNVFLLVNLEHSETGGTLLVDSFTFDPGLAKGDVVKITDWRIGQVLDTGMENHSLSFDARVIDIQKTISRHQNLAINIILESPDGEIITQLRELLRERNPEQFSN